MNRAWLRKLLSLIIVLIMLCYPLNAIAEQVPFELQSESAVLLDYNTGTILYEKKPNEKLPMASITKIMTILLVLEAIDDGRITLDSPVQISEYASGMGGTQAFLYPGEILTVSALLKAAIVASANDASVALAEKVYGTHEVFVQKMNLRAKELGLLNTHFVDCTGLSSENHYSSAYDTAIMSKELLKHPLFFKWSTIWTDRLDECKNKTELANTNRLVRFYDGCDGVKTGSTSIAKNCLSATAKRGNLRLISVVFAAPTSKIRFSEASKLMDYGFANFESVPIIKQNQIIEKQLNVVGGKINKVNAIASEDFSILVKKDEPKEVKRRIDIIFPIKAPIEKGERLGTLFLEKDGKTIGTVELIADDTIRKANLLDFIGKILTNWLKKK